MSGVTGVCATGLVDIGDRLTWGPGNDRLLKGHGRGPFTVRHLSVFLGEVYAEFEEGSLPGPWWVGRFIHATEAHVDTKPDGKLRWLLTPMDALTEVAHVFDHGERVRGKAPLGWRSVEDAPRKYAEALQRHTQELLSAIQAGGDLSAKDPESGRLVAAHIASTALILVDLALQSQKKE